MGIKVFDLPPGGLQDGAVAKEVNLDGSEITEESHITRKEFINAQNRRDKDVKSDVSVTESETRFATPTEENPAGSNAGGLTLGMRSKVAVHILRAEFPTDVIDEFNQHIDDVIIPNGESAAGGLVGQINRNERSAQLTIPHEGDEVGEQIGSVILRIGKEYMKQAIGDIECELDMQTMWTIHSYEGDYNPVHDHGTRTSMGLSCILYLKVPPQIEALGNPSDDFGGLNNASGNVDGFTYLCWGVNGMRDINMLRPITEEYVKPEVGTLIMFPSWLRHGVMPFFGEGERRTFSCNINVTPEQKVTGDHYRKDRT